MFNVSAWLSSLITMVLLAVDYCLYTNIFGLLGSGGYVVLGLIILIPITIISSLATIVNLINSFINAMVSRKWYLLALLGVNLIFIVIIVLTCIGIMPNAA